MDLSLLLYRSAAELVSVFFHRQHNSRKSWDESRESKDRHTYTRVHSFEIAWRISSYYIIQNRIICKRSQCFCGRASLLPLPIAVDARMLENRNRERARDNLETINFVSFILYSLLWRCKWERFLFCGYTPPMPCHNIQHNILKN